MSVKRRDFIRTAAAAAAAGAAMPGALLGRPAQDSGQRPNILLIIADDQGDRDAACYGHPTIRTPGLDRMAREGVRFTAGFVTTSSCSPSRGSMFTGLYPHATGAEALHQPQPASARILPGYLREMGYFTANVGKFHLGENVAAQLDRMEDSEWDWRRVLESRPAGKPFFLAVGFHDPHRPYRAGTVPDPTAPDDVTVPPYLADTPRTREDLAAYYDEILRMDRETGKILDWLEEQGLTSDTLVLFVSDNGMPFPRAKTTCYDSGIRVPFMARWPGRIPAGMVSDALISTVDLTPTVLSILGREVPGHMQGVDAGSLLFEPGAEVRDYVYFERNWHNIDDNQRGCRDSRFKYIRNYRPRVLASSSDIVGSPSWDELVRERDLNQLTPGQMRIFMTPRADEELYDTLSDPWEFNNLAVDPRYAGQLERMRAETEDWRARTGDFPPERRYEDNLDIFSRTKYGKTSGAPEPYDSGREEK